MQATRRQLPAIGVAGTLAAAILVAAEPALAQQLCLVHDDVVRQLAKQYDEQVSARGLSQDGKAMFEVFSSEAGSWTLVVTDVEGRSCVVASGDAWHPIERPRGHAS